MKGENMRKMNIALPWQKMENPPELEFGGIFSPEVELKCKEIKKGVFGTYSRKGWKIYAFDSIGTYIDLTKIAQPLTILGWRYIVY
jgi:hypothetical protein